MKQIPLDVLFGNPERASPRLSPDGRRIAFLAPRDGVLNVWLRDEDGRDRPVTRDRRRGIHHVLWAEDGRHLLYLQDLDGDENWHLFATDPESDLTRDLTPFVGVKCALLAVSPLRPRDVLVACYARTATHSDVYLVNIATGSMMMVEENPGDFASWHADRELEIVGATRHLDDGRKELLARVGPKDDWHVLRTYGYEDSFSGVLSDTADGRGFLLVDSTGRDTHALVRVERDGSAEETLAVDPRFDLDDVLLHPITREVQGYAFCGGRVRWEFVDASVERDFRAAEAELGGDLKIVSRDRHDKTWIVRSDKPDAPGACHLLRRGGRPELLFVERPSLSGYALAASTPVVIPARDGLELHGYLSLPPDGAKGPRPLVLHVHGGPNARDHWTYNPSVQFLCNRGYAVLQVNYRGSTGFGKAFVAAADRQWGGAMHDDLVDAVNWAVARGDADPKRLAIFGGSYGGYAALCGATLTPDLFRCAVDLFGPSNLVTLFESVPPSWKPFEAAMHRRHGHPVKDRDFLLSRSPLTHVDKVKIPILIAQGANDPRVVQRESDQMVERLRELGREVEYLLFKDEGHGFRKPENRLAFYRAAEAFLGRHL